MHYACMNSMLSLNWSAIVGNTGASQVKKSNQSVSFCYFCYFHILVLISRGEHNTEMQVYVKISGSCTCCGVK